MADEIISKRCPKCKTIKPSPEFYKSKFTKDGLHGWCKTCVRISQTLYAKTDKGKKAQRKSSLKYLNSPKGKARKNSTQRTYRKSEHGREIFRRYKKSDKGRITNKRYKSSVVGKLSARRYKQGLNGKRANKAQYIKHKQRWYARCAVSRAVKTGRLPKARTQKCACSKKASQWHHYLGYAREHWLDVIAVCRDCHKYLDSISKSLDVPSTNLCTSQNPQSALTG